MLTTSGETTIVLVICVVSPPGADGGIHIRRHQGRWESRGRCWKIQCKSAVGPSVLSDVQALNGTLADAELGVLIAVGGYTAPARQVAAGMPEDASDRLGELLDLILSYYPQLPDEAKLAIPLRRVWMPDCLSASD